MTHFLAPSAGANELPAIPNFVLSQRLTFDGRYVSRRDFFTLKIVKIRKTFLKFQIEIFVTFENRSHGLQGHLAAFGEIDLVFGVAVAVTVDQRVHRV